MLRHTLTVLSVSIFVYLAFASPEMSATEPATLNQPVYQQLHAQLQNQTSVHREYFPSLHPKSTTYNAEAPVPPQCYTKTNGQHNPCYVCHQNVVPGRENTMNDGSLQIEYAFSEVGMTNHWQNLFEDRNAAVAAISDEEILTWINQDNYSNLAPRLRKTDFQGWIPDLKNLHLGALAFDQEGFAMDGSQWVAFNYKPLPSTFWPTNGSTDDVMIRLSEPYRTDVNGNASKDVYQAYLANVEMVIKDLSVVSTPPIDEAALDRDINGDGQISVVTSIQRQDKWLGATQDFYLEASLYPEGTEFLHTVRYVGVDPEAGIVVPPRMKEVRYMKKWRGYPGAVYQREYQLVAFGKEAGRLPAYNLIGDLVLDNGFGWSVQGFIEGVDGELRTLTYEENLFCMGCHASVGATIDKTFAFPRKVDGAAGWRYIDLHGMPDAPNMGETTGEIATYLSRVGGGSEFRNNGEMATRWFKPDGSIDHDALAEKDVYQLVTPTPDRALTLNKAYRTIVAAQDYFHGRDATVTPPTNVYEYIDNETAPVLPADLFFPWDIRLDWQSQYPAKPTHPDTANAGG